MGKCDALAKLAKIAVSKCMRLKPGENALVLAETDSDRSVADAFMVAAHAAGANVALAVFPTQPRTNLDPPKVVAEAMKAADAIIDVVVKYFVYTDTYSEVLQNARVLMMPGTPKELLLSPMALEVDLEDMRRRTRNLAALFDRAKTCRITSLQGTDVHMDLSNRVSAVRDSTVFNPGDLDYIPSGYLMIAPVEETVDGVIVLDGSLSPTPGILKDPVKLSIKEGRIVRVDGGTEARIFEKWLRDFDDPNMYYIAHVGAGTNPKAKLTGKSVIDEKIFGAVNVGIGHNAIPTLKGKIKAKSHADGIVMEATLFLDDAIIIDKGRYVHPSLL